MQTHGHCRPCLDAIFAVIDEKHDYLHDFEEAVQTTANMIPEDFLDRVFSGDEAARKRRRFFIERKGMDRLPLGKLNIETLISWCAKQGDSDVRPIVGASINLWKTNDEEKSVSLSEEAMKFLESAPDAHAMLSAYASRMEPRSGRSGGQAETMKPTADAIGALSKSANTDIAKAAEAVVIEAIMWIESIRQREQRRDKEREQTFE